MNRIEKYIPIAINVVEDLFLNDTFKVDKKYLTLIQDLGYSIRMYGINTALFSDSQENEKKVLLEGIYSILLLSEGKSTCAAKSLLDEKNVKLKDRLFQKRLVDAIIALKLAIRLYVDKTQIEESDGEYTDEY